jgi:hypothetical protein
MASWGWVSGPPAVTVRAPPPHLALGTTGHLLGRQVPIAIGVPGLLDQVRPFFRQRPYRPLAATSRTLWTSLAPATSGAGADRCLPHVFAAGAPPPHPPATTSTDLLRVQRRVARPVPLAQQLRVQPARRTGARGQRPVHRATAIFRSSATTALHRHPRPTRRRVQRPLAGRDQDRPWAGRARGCAGPRVGTCRGAVSSLRAKKGRVGGGQWQGMSSRDRRGGGRRGDGGPAGSAAADRPPWSGVTTARLCVWLSAFLFILVSSFVVGCGGESS